LAILLRALRPRRPLRRHNRNATGRSIATPATIAIAAAVVIAIETAIVAIATAIATFGATVRGIRAAMAVQGVKILVTIAVNPIRAGPRIRANRSATPAAASAASCLAKTRLPGKTRRLAKTKRLAKTSRPVKTRRLAKIKHLAPAMKLSARPMNGANAANAAAEAGADGAVADVTVGKTQAMAQARISLRAKAAPTTLPAQMSPGRERPRRRQRRRLTSAQSVRRLNRPLVSNLP
jgi:hypothetical protein